MFTHCPLRIAHTSANSIPAHWVNLWWLYFIAELHETIISNHTILTAAQSKTLAFFIGFSISYRSVSELRVQPERWLRGVCSAGFQGMVCAFLFKKKDKNEGSCFGVVFWCVLEYVSGVCFAEVKPALLKVDHAKKKVLRMWWQRGESRFTSASGFRS